MQLLVQHGHDAAAVGDYSPWQLMAYVRAIQKIDGIQASLEMTLMTVAIGAVLSDKAAAQAAELARVLQGGGKTDPVEQMLGAAEKMRR